MPIAEIQPDLTTLAGSIGLLIDRSGEEDEVLGSCWLIDSNKVATCAHLVTIYGDKLEALKVYFPALAQSHGIGQALFHPRFNRKHSAKLTSDGLWDSIENMHLQNFNAVVLSLTPNLSVLGEAEKKIVNQSLTISTPQLDAGLGGNLSDIDFFLIIQTITNARKEGVLVISDTRNRPVARLFCQNGRIVHAIYRNLTNELAIYQIVQRKLKGNFFFKAHAEADWPAERAIARPPEMMLLEAHRRLDEMEKCASWLGGSDAAFCRAVPWMNDGILPVEVAETARALWPHLDGTIPISSFWKVVNVDDYAVYNALVELYKTRQIENIDETREFPTAPHASSAKVTPLNLVPQVSLVPGDEVQNLSVDARRGTARVRKGTLLGSLMSDDPYHLVHTMALLPEACGTPMFKDGAVIGMHSGPLPPAPDLDENEGVMQQMFWSECILECLNSGGEVELAKKLSESGEEIAKKITMSGTNAALKRPDLPGCREVARVGCPKCGKTSLDSARFCKSCGQRLLADPQYKPRKKVFSQAPLVVATFVFMGAIAMILLWMAPAKPNFLNPPLSYIPDIPWVQVTIHGFNKMAHEAPAWHPIPDGAALNNNVQVYLDMKVNDDCYLYVLSDSPKGKEKHATLEFPEPKSKEVMLKKGEHFTVPKETIIEATSNGRKGFIMNGLVTGPADTTVLIASRKPLPLLADPDTQNLFFENANRILCLDRFAAGIEVPVSEIAPNLFPANVDGTPGDSIYLKRLMEKIATD